MSFVVVVVVEVGDEKKKEPDAISRLLSLSFLHLLSLSPSLFHQTHGEARQVIARSRQEQLRAGRARHDPDRGLAGPPQDLQHHVERLPVERERDEVERRVEVGPDLDAPRHDPLGSGGDVRRLRAPLRELVDVSDHDRRQPERVAAERAGRRALLPVAEALARLARVGLDRRRRGRDVPGGARVDPGQQEVEARRVPDG